MKMFARLAGLALACASGTAMAAQAPAPADAPDLVVVISVDQLSTDLFNAYRPHFTGGLKRLASGVAFANGYQAHAATETCPGHSTILTGSHPARTGIIANQWYDRDAARADKTIYCAEDERVAGSNSDDYTVSNVHLRVPTLGDHMKRADPESRVVSVAGKDRSSVMMGGQAPDLRLYWQDGRFVSPVDAPLPPVVAQVNAGVARAIATARPPLTPPPYCTGRDRAVQVGSRTFGTHRFGRAAGDAGAWQRSPEFDAATLTLAAALIQQMQLGRSGHTDLIAIGASATDYVGHSYGSGGMEMCLQLASLDADLDAFFRLLDRAGIDYAVALTADHGGLDIPERTGRGARVERSATPSGVGAEIGRRLGLSGPVLTGDWYVAADVPAARRAEVVAMAREMLAAHPQVEAVFTSAEVGAHPLPTTRPEQWSLLDKMRASYDPKRSGDLLVALKEGVLNVMARDTGSIAGHGSVWDYDRKVPILFWWPGLLPQDRPQSAQTVDILPTLASLIGVPVAGEIDGKCLDLRPGEATNCR